MNEKDFSKFTFSIIKQFNSPTEAVTVDGNKVYRKEKVYIPEWGAFAKCAPYDNHFVYLDTSNKVGRWFAVCTCGSPAVLVGFDAYKRDSSKEPLPMLVCYAHASIGTHTTDSSWYTGGVN